MKTLSRSMTRKRRTMPNNTTLKNKYTNLQYLGSGSYGSVYEIKGTRIALKEHRISALDSDDLCEKWSHEFNVQQNVFRACNAECKRLGVSVTKPFVFSYGKRDETGHMISLPTATDASSCFYTMERVPGLRRAPRCVIQKLYKFIKPTIRIKPTPIPPYLQLGTLYSITGHVSLDMVKGTQVVSFPNDSYTYCLVEGVALELMKAMVLSFFVIVDKGFIPRDIEYVFNGECDNAYAKIIDFNEVKTHEERRGDRVGYHLEDDVAHVYIDLCGMRSLRDKNPQTPYDAPTPQWRFLPSPLVSPSAFFQCMDAVLSYGFTQCAVDVVIRHILSYTEHRIRPALERISGMQWIPTKPHFSDRYVEFDRQLQIYFISGLCATADKRRIPVDSALLTDYESSLKYLQELLAPSTVAEAEWEFPGLVE
jgi:hypothetical protein